jgi:hypothetical protein
MVSPGANYRKKKRKKSCPQLNQYWTYCLALTWRFVLGSKWTTFPPTEAIWNCGHQISRPWRTGKLRQVPRAFSLYMKEGLGQTIVWLVKLTSIDMLLSGLSFLDRVIDVSALQNVLTWDGGARFVTLMGVDLIGWGTSFCDGVLLCWWLWIYCRWPSLKSINHLEIRPGLEPLGWVLRPWIVFT